MQQFPPSTRGLITRPEQVGEMARAERKRQGLTLDQVYETTNLSTRFLSEFERGKPHVSLSRALRALQSLGLDVVVVPRNAVPRVISALAEESS